MDPKPSVMEMLARLEQQIAHNVEREAFHAGHEAFHRDQRSSYADELERLTRCRDSLKAGLYGRISPSFGEVGGSHSPSGKGFHKLWSCPA